MKFCQNCGKKQEEGVRFCVYCGTKLDEDVKEVKKEKKEEVKEEEVVEEKVVEEVKPVREEPTYSYNEPPKKKGKGKAIILSIIIVLLVAAVTVLLILLLTKGSGSKEDDNGDPKKPDVVDTDDKLEDIIVGEWNHTLKITEDGEVSYTVYQNLEIKKNGKFHFERTIKGYESTPYEFDGTYEVKDDKVVLTVDGDDMDAYYSDGKLCLSKKNCKAYLTKEEGTNIKIEYDDFIKEYSNDDIETEEKTTCTLSQDYSTYSVKATYTIYYTGKYVNKVNTVEEITSDDETILDQVKATTEESYEEADKAYGGYDYFVTKFGNKVTAETTIDYKVMNLKKYAEDQPEMKNYMEDGKITVDGIKSVYKMLGATCK